jgi:ABC-type multidrug transport system fused ATPase/permease subunit
MHACYNKPLVIISDFICEKSQFYAKKILFFSILGGACIGCAPTPPPWIRPRILNIFFFLVVIKIKGK